jgi:transaldolase / glucose-6-phosphate isomerase
MAGRGGKPLRYEVTTELAPQEALARAIAYFGRGGQGLEVASKGNLSLSNLERAHQIWVSYGPFIPAEANPGVSLGTLLGLAARQGRDKVTLVPSESLQALGAWAAQLLTTSTGKEGLGLVPVVHEALGTPEGYGTDRVFVSLRLAKDENAAGEKQLAALEQAGHPVVRIAMPNAIGLGAECFRWEVAAATAGAIVGADPL